MVDLVRIELENFRCFFEKKDIDLGLSDKKLIIFEGNTGDGKSSLLESIHWCLFGIYPTPFDGEKADFILFNQQALVNAKQGEVITCKVNLTFEKDTDQKIIFSRVIQVKRVKDIPKNLRGGYEVSEDEFSFIKQTGNIVQKFSAVRWEGSEQKTLEENVVATRESYFPKIVSDYYMIYGEKFIDPKNPEIIKLAIEKNCFADIFDKIKDNLSSVKNEVIRKSLSNNNKKEKMDKLSDSIRENKELLNGKKEELDNAKKQKIEVEQAISKIDTEYGRSGGERRKKLVQYRIEMTNELKGIIRDIYSYEKELSGDGFKLSIRLLSEPSLNALFDEINQRVKKGEIPAKIRTEFINSLIKKRHCICERKLGDEEVKILIKIRDEEILGNNYNNFLDLKYELNSTIKGIPIHIKDYLSKTNRLEELKSNRIRIDEELKRISLEFSSLKNPGDLEDIRKKMVRAKETLETDIILLTSKIEETKGQIKKDEKEIDKFGEVGSYEGKKASIFINELKSNLDLIKREVIESTRKDIESYASEVYKELYQTATKIKSVELDEDYKVRVIIIQEDNKEYVKTNFSTGEGLVFAISFLTALRRYSGYEGPIFLDSPYSVLDPKHRIKISLNLPKAVPGQLIILTRPDTFEDTKSKMKSFINKIVTLKKEREWHTIITMEKN